MLSSSQFFDVNLELIATVLVAIANVCPLVYKQDRYGVNLTAKGVYRE